MRVLPTPGSPTTTSSRPEPCMTASIPARIAENSASRPIREPSGTAPRNPPAGGGAGVVWIAAGGLARSGDEGCPGIPRQLQGLDQQLDGVPTGRSLHPALQVADRARAQARPLRQLLLGHTGKDPVAPEKVPKWL